MLLRNSKGFSAIAFLILLPFLLITSSVLASSYIVMRSDSEIRHVCRSWLLEAQDEIGDTLEDLVSLNAQARRLRATRKTIENAARVALTPQAQLAAQTALKATILAQTQLAARQRALYFRGKTLSRTAPLRVKQELERRLLQTRRITRDDFQSLGLQTQIHPGQFAVIASPVESLTPDYFPAPHFSETQTTSVHWRFSTAAILPRWLNSFVASSNLQSGADCAVTLVAQHPSQKESHKWIAQLKKVR